MVAGACFLCSGLPGLEADSHRSPIDICLFVIYEHAIQATFLDRRLHH